MKYIVQSASARVPSQFGTYRRVAVLLVKDGVEHASMISERSRDVVEVVRTWENCNVGTTSRCAYERARAEARELAAELNGAL